MYFRYFLTIFLWKRAKPLLVQNWIPFTHGCIVPSLVEIGPVVLEKKIFNIFKIILLFRHYLPLEKGVALHLYKLNPSTQKCFVSSLVKIGAVVWRKRFKCEKFTDRLTTDDRRSEKLTWAFGIGELKITRSLKIFNSEGHWYNYSSNHNSNT